MILYYSLSLYWSLCLFYSIFLLIVFLLKLSLIYSFPQLSKYGKTLPKSESKGFFMFPKSWFLYFYIIAVFFNTCIWLYLITGHTIDLRAYSHPTFLSPDTALYLLVLSTIQCTRRLFESLFVSRFSKSAMMHISFTLLGATYYTAIALSLLASSETVSLHMIPLQFFLSPNVILGTLLFLIASYHQFNCHRILADLRKPSAKTASSTYSIPYGDWFKYLSAPHYIADLLVYIAYLIISGGTCPLIWWLNIYTSSAMLYCAITTHYWYKETFKDYPKDRKSVLPFIF